MSLSYSKVIVVALIFLGEALAIYAEMLGAKTYSLDGKLFLQIFLKMFLIIMIGGSLLVAGYMFGFKTFKNIWAVSVISITSILIIEPILAILFFKQWPTTGAMIGLILGALGFMATIFL